MLFIPGMEMLLMTRCKTVLPFFLLAASPFAGVDQTQPAWLMCSLIQLSDLSLTGLDLSLIITCDYDRHAGARW